MIFTQVKHVMKSLYSEKAEHEALLSYDFKLVDLRTALLRLCFSPLANWPLLVWILVLGLNPFRYQHQVLSQFPSLTTWIYSPQWGTGLAIGIIFSYFAGMITIPIVLVLYFVSQGEIHTVLATSILFGVFLGRALKYLKVSVKLEGKTRLIAIYFALTQILSLIAAIGLGLWIYQYMTVMNYFSKSVFAYRFEFIMTVLTIIYIAQLIVNAVWGHFYSRQQDEPSQVNIFYSTAKILRRLVMGRDLSEKLKQQAEAKYAEQSIQLKDASTVYLPKNILESAQEEKLYLEEALRFWSSPVQK